MKNNKLRSSMEGIASEAIRLNKLRKICHNRGFHNKVDASYTDWKGNYHPLEKCLDCNTYFDKEIINQ